MAKNGISIGAYSHNILLAAARISPWANTAPRTLAAVIGQPADRSRARCEIVCSVSERACSRSTHHSQLQFTAAAVHNGKHHEFAIHFGQESKRDAHPRLFYSFSLLFAILCPGGHSALSKMANFSLQVLDGIVPALCFWHSAKNY